MGDLVLTRFMSRDQFPVEWIAYRSSFEKNKNYGKLMVSLRSELANPTQVGFSDDRSEAIAKLKGLISGASV